MFKRVRGSSGKLAQIQKALSILRAPSWRFCYAGNEIQQEQGFQELGAGKGKRLRKDEFLARLMYIKI